MAKKYRVMKGRDVGISSNRFGSHIVTKGFGKGPYKDATMIGYRSRRRPGDVTGRIGGAGLYRLMGWKK